MKILCQASAGMDSKEDAFVTISPITGENEILIHSPVKELYGHLIEAAGQKLLAQYGITTGCRLEVHDHSALDYVIRARIETAITRNIKGEHT